MEKLHGGRADGMSPSEFNQKELIAGTIHEMEHTDDPPTAMEIAMDHLVEHPDYYEVLVAMESSMKPTMHPNIAGAAISEGAMLAREAPVVYQSVRAAAPEIAAGARVVVPRAAGWISRAAQWLREGWKENEVIKKLVATGIPKRAAKAITDAAEAFLISELQLAASKGADRLRKKRGDGQPTMQPNASDYYVWTLNRNYEPIEGPYGPHDLLSSKTFARISASKGRHARAVSIGTNVNSRGFHIVRIYRAETGERLL